MLDQSPADLPEEAPRSEQENQWLDVIYTLKGDKGVKSLVYKGKSLKSPLKKA